MKSATFSILLLHLVFVIYVGGEKVQLTENGLKAAEDFNIKQAPYQVIVVKKTTGPGGDICRGAIVKNNAIVTSALCISNLSKEPKDLLVLNGIVPNQAYWSNSTISKITLHPKFNASLTTNNIAIVHLNGTFNSTISYLKTGPKENTPCRVYSYKPLPPGMVDVNTTCVHNCQRAYNASTPRYVVDIDTMICTNDTKKTNVICEGDVGAPLVCNNVLAGLAIYSQECQNNKMASVFVGIAPYAKWIDSTINSSSINSMSSLSVIIGTIISFSITKLLSR